MLSSIDDMRGDCFLVRSPLNTSTESCIPALLDPLRGAPASFGEIETRTESALTIGRCVTDAEKKSSTPFDG